MRGKLSSHNRRGSYKTKARYAETLKRFLVYLAEEFRLEKLANIAPKHLFAYVDSLSEKGFSAAYIKTELSAIRFFTIRFQSPDIPCPIIPRWTCSDGDSAG